MIFQDGLFQKERGIWVQICNIHILVTIQVTRLKFGTFPYQIWHFSFPVQTYVQNFMDFWKYGFQTPIICPSLMWNFPYIAYIRKSSASNTDPCGTPLLMVDIFELKLLIETDCFWLVKYVLNHLFDILFTL